MARSYPGFFKPGSSPSQLRHLQGPCFGRAGRSSGRDQGEFYSYRDSPSSCDFRRSIWNCCPPFFLSADLDVKAFRISSSLHFRPKVGGCSDDPLYRPLCVHRGGRNLRGPGGHYGDHFSLFHLIESRKKPASYARPGCFSHPHLLTSLPLRCFLPALLLCCPFDPLSGAAYPSRV